MEPKREQAFVGLFVLIVAGVLIFTVFTVSGAFSGAGATYLISVSFGGGIEPGATVRYAGGPKVGRVEHMRLDPPRPAPANQPAGPGVCGLLLLALPTGRSRCCPP